MGSRLPRPEGESFSRACGIVAERWIEQESFPLSLSDNFSPIEISFLNEIYLNLKSIQCVNNVRAW